MQLRSIDIDVDVHRHIEGNRTSFGQTANDILRGLFGLSSTFAGGEEAADEAQAAGAWSWKGVTLPAGTEVRMTYNGRTHAGVISGGIWQIAGANYTSPSSAAAALARSREGKRVSLNGWRQWEVRKPGSDEWAALHSLRPANSRRRRSSRRRRA